MKPTEKDIEAMVDRFLGWTLPRTFNPDGGIEFIPPAKLYPGMKNPNEHWPCGTNLLDADQAKAMILYLFGMEQLRPCPFCGADGSHLAITHLSSDEYEGETVNCSHCNAQVPISSWQRRI